MNPEEAKRELQVGDRVVMVRFDSEPFSWDEIGMTGTVEEILHDVVRVALDVREGETWSYYKANEPWQILEEPITYNHIEVSE